MELKLAGQARIVLDSTREIELHDLKQHRTYAGFLEGVPNRRWNREYLKRLRRDCEKKAGSTPVILIQPTEKRKRVAGRRASGSVVLLPFVTCIGRFRSSLDDHGPFTFSQLIIVWLQDDFAMPIAHRALHRIMNTEWEKVAKRFQD